MTYAEAEAYERQGQIKIHDPKVAFPGMAAAGKLAAECLDMLVPETKEGVTTGRLDDLARQFVFDHGALPACVNYRGYRHTICTSLNHTVCHGIPGDRVLKDGDIVNIDVTSIINGYHGDTSRMYHVGNVSPCIERIDHAVGNVRTEPLSALHAKLVAAGEAARACRACWTACRGVTEALGGGSDARSLLTLATRMRP